MRQLFLTIGTFQGFNKNIKNMIMIFKKLIYHNDSHPKLHLWYIQDLLNTKIEQVERKYSGDISHKLSKKNLNPKKYWCFLKIISNGKKYLAYLNSSHHIKSLLKSFHLDMLKNVRQFLVFFWTFQWPVVFLSFIKHY